MEAPGSSDRDARDAFLRVYQEDLAQGRLRSLADYQSLFPGREAEIADEYSFLEDGEDTQTDRGTSTTEVLPDPALTLQTVGPYRLLRELGRGGQAVVYLAVHRSLGRRVALKILRRHAAIDLGSESELRRFRREASVASRLDHPAICSVYEAGEADGYAFIAMRYVEGRSLAEKIAGHATGRAPTTRLDETPADEPLVTPDARGVLPGKAEVASLVALVEKIARALHVAHEQGLIHRDVKPANLMITHEGEPVILDFGLAREEESKGYSLTRTGDVMGTPYYMAPEQLGSHHAPLDRRTDVYGLAVTLYEALTLRRPFEAKSRQALYQKILHAEPVDPRSWNRAIPRDLHVVIQKALAKRPEHRYATALEFAEDLRRVRTFEPVLARPIGPVLRLVRWSRKRPGIAFLLAVLLLFTLGFTWELVENQARLATLRERLERRRELAHLHVLDRLVHTAAEELWPTRPESWERLAAWEAEVDALVAKVPQFERALEAVLEEESDPLAFAWESAEWRRLLQETRALTVLRGRIRERADALRDAFPTSVPTTSWEAWRDAVRTTGRAAERADLVPLPPRGEEGNALRFLHVPTCSRDGASGALRADGLIFRGLVADWRPGGRAVFVAERPPNAEQRARAAAFVELDAQGVEALAAERERLWHRLGVRLATPEEQRVLRDQGFAGAFDAAPPWLIEP